MSKVIVTETRQLMSTITSRIYEGIGTLGNYADAYWKYIGTSDRIEVAATPTSGGEYNRTKSVVTVKKNVAPSDVVNAKMFLAYRGGAEFGISGKGIVRTVNDGLEVDLTEEFCSSGSTFDLTFYPVKWGGCAFDDTMCHLEVSYMKEEPTTIERLTIDTYPDKMTYMEGTVFDPSGMKVVANYSDGTTSVVTDYTYTKSPITTTNRVIVSYNGVSVDVGVCVRTVFDVLGEKNYSHNEYLDNPKYNLVTGKIRYVYPDLSVGEDSFTMAVSHVYVSDKNEAMARLFDCYGDGWKIDMDQRLLKQGSKYKLVDGLGYVHTFELFDEKGNRYYDVDDPTITLTEKDGQVVLGDDVGNITVFDSSGKISYTQAGTNAKITKHFIYDSQGRLSKIYDKRTLYDNSPRTYLAFGYISGKLGSITAVKNGKTTHKLRYDYTGGTLSQVTEEGYNDSGLYIHARRIATFYYSDGRLSTIRNDVSKETVKIAYDADAKASKISYGIATYGNAFSEKSYIDIRKSYLRPVFTDEKGLKTTLHLSDRGRVLSAFEYIDDKNVKTLEREYGYGVALSSSSGDRVNGSAAVYVNANSPLTIASRNIQSRGEEDYKHYSLTFWLKLSRTSYTRLRAVLEHDNQSTYAEVNPTSGVWQKVAIPVTISNNKKTGDFKVCIKNTSGGIVEAHIADVYIVPGSAQKLNVGIGDYSDCENIVVGRQTPSGIDEKTYPLFSDEVYFTETDIAANYVQPIKTKTVSGAQLYDIICNNQSKRISGVKYVRIKKGNKTRELFGNDAPQSETENLTYECTTDNSFAFKTVSPDGSTVSYAYMCPSGDNVYIQKSISVRPSGSFASKTSSAFILKDKFDRTLREKDAYGVITEYERNIDVTSAKYGRLMRTYRKGTDGKIMLIGATEYDPSGETVSATSDGVTATSYTLFNNGNVNKTVFGSSSGYPTGISGITTEYFYDAFGRNVTKVKQTAGNLSVEKNFEYDDRGNLRKVKDGMMTASMRTDRENDTVEYMNSYGNGETVILKKKAEKFDTYNETAKVTADYYNTENIVTCKNELYTDKYGKTVKTTCTDETPTTYTYEGGSVSEAAWQLIEIADGYDGRTYKNSYDDSGALIAQSVENTDGTSAQEIHEVAAGETRYYFGNGDGKDRYKSKITYDEDVTVEPRITKTQVYNGGKGAKDDWTECHAFTREYDYDSVGRLARKYATTHTLASTAGINDSFVYKDGESGLTPLVETFEHDRLEGVNTWKIKQEYDYDDKGNVTSIASNGSLNKNFVYSSTQTYKYDDFSRITSSTYKLSDGTVRSCSVGYDGNRISHINGRVHNYIGGGWHCGKLGSVGNFTYDYDNYGNRKATTISGQKYESYDYYRGNLLKHITRENPSDYTYFMCSNYYNHQGMRIAKVAKGVRIDYYLDGAKILGEDRSDGIKLRYFYDKDGIVGFSYRNGNAEEELYNYVRDVFGNVIAIEGQDGEWVCFYDYDILGRCEVRMPFSDSSAKCLEIANVNPFRWKGCYMDTETGYYNMSSKFYDPEVGVYINADDAETIANGVADRNGFDGEFFDITPYGFDIFTVSEMYPDIILSAKTWIDRLFEFFSFLKNAMLCCILGTENYI